MTGSGMGRNPMANVRPARMALMDPAVMAVLMGELRWTVPGLLIRPRALACR